MPFPLTTSGLHSSSITNTNQIVSLSCEAELSECLEFGTIGTNLTSIPVAFNFWDVSGGITFSNGNVVTTPTTSAMRTQNTYTDYVSVEASITGSGTNSVAFGLFLSASDAQTNLNTYDGGMSLMGLNSFYLLFTSATTFNIMQGNTVLQAAITYSASQRFKVERLSTGYITVSQASTIIYTSVDAIKGSMRGCVGFTNASCKADSLLVYINPVYFVESPTPGLLKQGDQLLYKTSGSNSCVPCFISLLTEKQVNGYIDDTIDSQWQQSPNFTVVGNLINATAASNQSIRTNSTASSDWTIQFRYAYASGQTSANYLTLGAFPYNVLSQFSNANYQGFSGAVYPYISVYILSGTLYIMDKTTQISTFVLTLGNIIRISRVGSVMKVYVNDVLKGTYTTKWFDDTYFFVGVNGTPLLLQDVKTSLSLNSSRYIFDSITSTQGGIIQTIPSKLFKVDSPLAYFDVDSSSTNTNWILNSQTDSALSTSDTVTADSNLVQVNGVTKTSTTITVQSNETKWNNRDFSTFTGDDILLNSSNPDYNTITNISLNDNFTFTFTPTSTNYALSIYLVPTTVYAVKASKLQTYTNVYGIELYGSGDLFDIFENSTGVVKSTTTLSNGTPYSFKRAIDGTITLYSDTTLIYTFNTKYTSNMKVVIGKIGSAVNKKVESISWQYPGYQYTCTPTSQFTPSLVTKFDKMLYAAAGTSTEVLDKGMSLTIAAGTTTSKLVTTQAASLVSRFKSTNINKTIRLTSNGSYVNVAHGQATETGTGPYTTTIPFTPTVSSIPTEAYVPTRYTIPMEVTDYVYGQMGGTGSLISAGSGTPIGNFTANGSPYRAFGTSLIQTSVYYTASCISTASVAGAYIGKYWGNGYYKTLTGFRIYGSLDHGFVYSANPYLTFTVYGSNTMPSAYNSGTSLGTISYTDISGPSVVSMLTGLTVTTPYMYHWITITGTTDKYYISYIEFYENSTSSSKLTLTGGKTQLTSDATLTKVACKVRGTNSKLNSIKVITEELRADSSQVLLDYSDVNYSSYTNVYNTVNKYIGNTFVFSTNKVITAIELFLLTSGNAVDFNLYLTPITGWSGSGYYASPPAGNYNPSTSSRLIPINTSYITSSAPGSWYKFILPIPMNIDAESNYSFGIDNSTTTTVIRAYNSIGTPPANFCTFNYNANTYTCITTSMLAYRLYGY